MALERIVLKSTDKERHAILHDNDDANHDRTRRRRTPPPAVEQSWNVTDSFMTIMTKTTTKHNQTDTDSFRTMMTQVTTHHSDVENAFGCETVLDRQRFLQNDDGANHYTQQ